MKKTVNINGEKVKVDFNIRYTEDKAQSEETISYYQIEGSSASRKRVKYTEPKQTSTKLIFSINDIKYNVVEVFENSLRKGNITFSKYFLIGNERFKSEKTAIEYLLTK